MDLLTLFSSEMGFGHPHRLCGHNRWEMAHSWSWWTGENEFPWLLPHNSPFHSQWRAEAPTTVLKVETKSHYYWIKEHSIAPEHSGLFLWFYLEIEGAGYQQSIVDACSWKGEKIRGIETSVLPFRWGTSITVKGSYVLIIGQREEKYCKMLILLFFQITQ